MLRNAFATTGAAARELFRSWGALALLHLLYVALLASVYLFVTTREASVPQLILTALAALAVPVLFFVLQAAGVASFAEAGARLGSVLRRALGDFWKIFLISVPLILLAVLIVYLTNKLQAYFVAADTNATPRPPALTPVHPLGITPPAPMRWSDALIFALRLLLLGIVLPLTAIHLWLNVARNGLRATLKKSLRILARALAPQSVLIYVVGMIFFALMPYFLIFTRTPVTNTWLELLLFGLRLALAFVLTLWGWVATIGALEKSTAVMQERVEVLPDEGVLARQ
ncbi:MAG: hypothetical protein M3430_00735 [Acidobacteriota bacterium]|nr:hypothetical protein [Acidobacteriota bacterium]